MSVLGQIVTNAIKFPRRLAVRDDRQTYTYAKLVGGAMFLAEKIEAVSTAAHVGIMLPTSGSFSLALLAIWLAKRVAVPLNYLLAPDELCYVIEDSDIDTIITAEVMLEVFGGSTIPHRIGLLRIENVDFTGPPPLRWPPMAGGDDLACILYTSGTSGRPKGVMLTHRNLRTNVEAGIRHASIGATDSFLGVLPQFHSFGLTGLTLIPLFVGAKVIYSARFIPRRIVGLIRRYRPTIVMAVPSMYGALLSVKDAKGDDLKSIRFAISGGEPLPDATFGLFQERFNLSLLEGYGLTETAPITNWSTPQQFKRHSVGPCVPGVQVVITDQNNRPLPPNREGEILIAGPNIMKGYYKLPEQTAAAFVDLPVPHHGDATSRGHFRTGDMGHLDEDGFLYITGRKKEMLIIGGENVFPREIEEVLNEHPSVRDAAVIGKMDGMRGETPFAFVELAEEHTFDETELRSWCRQRLAGYKIPRKIQPIEELPRNPTGKILRRQLVAE